MANPTARVNSPSAGFDQTEDKLPMAATVQTYYVGEMLGRNAAGYGTKCDDTAALQFEGLMKDSPDFSVPTGAAAGDHSITVDRPRRFYMNIAAAVITDRGRPVFALYSNEVSFLSGTYKNFVGWVSRLISATVVEIEPGPVGGSPIVPASTVYSAPVTTTGITFFRADRAYRVIGITGRVRVVGSDGGAVTAVINKVPSGTAPASGTILHTGTLNLKGAADTDQDLALHGTSANLDLAAGDSLALVPTGTTTAATGHVTVQLIPVGK